VSALEALNDSTWPSGKNRRFKCIEYNTDKNIDDYRLQFLNDLFGIKLIFYDPSCMFQLSEFAWTLRFSVRVVFNNFLLIDAT